MEGSRGGVRRGVKHGFSEDFSRILGFSEIFFTIHGFSDNFNPQFFLDAYTDASQLFRGYMTPCPKIAHDQTLRQTQSAYKHKHTHTHTPTQTPAYPQEFSSPFQEDILSFKILRENFKD